MSQISLLQLPDACPWKPAENCRFHAAKDESTIELVCAPFPVPKEKMKSL